MSKAQGTALLKTITGADPAFPVELGANPPRGVPTYDFADFSKKKNGHKLVREGGTVTG